MPARTHSLTDGITTFTVGMAGVTDEGFALLDAIAVAGGSDCTPGAAGDEACDVSTSGAAGFLAALNTIRETVSVTETMTMRANRSRDFGQRGRATGLRRRTAIAIGAPKPGAVPTGAAGTAS